MTQPGGQYPPYGGAPATSGYGPGQPAATTGYPGQAPAGYPSSQPGAGYPGPAPGAYPPGQSPAGYPGQPGAGARPPGQPASGYPPSTQPGGYPPATQPGGYPPATQPGGYPPSTQPGGYSPGQQQPGGAQQGYPPQPGFAPQPGGPGGAPPGMDPNVYQWFVSVDADKSGRINMFELQQALTNSNWTHFNAETCRLMIGLFDRDQSGQIDVNEFGALWQYITQWRGVFEQFDRDKSGSIDVTELNTAYTQMGYRLSPQFAQMVVFRYDPLAKQRLTLDNFIQSCVLLKTVTETFKQKDTRMQGSVQLSYEEFLTMVLLNKPS